MIFEVSAFDVELMTIHIRFETFGKSKAGSLLFRNQI